MRELVEGKNTIGRTAAVLKKPYKVTFNLLTFLRLVPVKFGISRLSRAKKKISPPQLIQKHKGLRNYVVKMTVKVQFGTNWHSQMSDGVNAYHTMFTKFLLKTEQVNIS